MNSLRVVWGSTTMVVLTALSAALYAAILIPFKILPIIPGVTEVRPANAIPIVCSLWFGPAGAWGSAFGNLIGDFIGLGLGPGSLFGMLGNFLYGFVPYVFWRAMFGAASPRADRPAHWAGLIFICAVSSAACAFSIGWGIDVVIRGVPFAVLATIIFFNNFLMSVLLAPPLLFTLLPRIRNWGLLYTQILPEPATVRPRLAWLGVVLMTAGAFGGLAGGVAVGSGIYGQRVGVPKLLEGIRKAAMPVPGPSTRSTVSANKSSPSGEPVASANQNSPSVGSKVSAKQAATTPGLPAGPVTATVSATAGVAKGNAWPATPAELAPLAPGAWSGRAALGFGLLPFLALMFLGVLLL
jgi:energy-coupling factor transport system substrate-specific component